MSHAPWKLAGLLTLVAGCAPQTPVPEAFLPGIAVERRHGLVQLDGEACLDRGILEYIAVAAGGKEYESGFRLTCRPSHVHLAMLLAGYQAGRLPDEARGDFAFEPAASVPTRPAGAPAVPAAPPGDEGRLSPTPTRVTIDVDVTAPHGGWQRRPIESFLIDRRTGASPSRLAWAFTGSFFRPDVESGTERFVADDERSLIALWYDPTALLNLTQSVGNPYRGNASGLELDPATVPARGTPVRLILNPVAADPRGVR